MPKIITAAAIALSLLPAAAAVGQDTQADLRYCSALSQLYGRYVGAPENGPNTTLPRDVEGRYALYKCQQGDAQTAIPILEKRLRNAKVELPARG